VQATHRGSIGGGARPAAHDDRAGRRTGRRAGPCAHPVEGQPGPGRSWLDRCRDRRRAGGQPRHRGPGPHAVCRGGAGRCGVPQGARAPVPPPAGRGAGGPPGRAGMQRAAPGPQALDVAAAGRSAGGLKDANIDNSAAPAATQGLSGQWAQPSDMASYPPATAAGVSDQTPGLSVPASGLPPTGGDPAWEAGPAYGERSPLVTDDQAGRQGTL